jgi:hypothetical protein
MPQRAVGSRKRKIVAVSIAAIIAFLTSFFNGAPALFKQITALFRKNLADENKKLDDAVEKESKDRDQGGLPKWDE